jgi:transposase
LLPGIDLHSGIIIPLVEPRHRSAEFIKYLKKLAGHYPEDWKIRVILDNHSSHRSKETMNFRKVYQANLSLSFTPTHGSWLNMIEMFLARYHGRSSDKYVLKAKMNLNKGSIRELRK